MSDVCPHTVDNNDHRDEKAYKAIADQLSRIEMGPPDEDESAGEGGKTGKRRKKVKKQEMIKMTPLNGSAKEHRTGGDNGSDFQEYELADDAINELGDRGDSTKPQEDDVTVEGEEKENGADENDDDDDFVKIGCSTSNGQGKKLMGQEELPVVGSILPSSKSIDDAPVILRWAQTAHGFKDKFATFPKMNRRRRFYNNKRVSLKGNKSSHRKSVPTRVTKDGTSIFYWCDANRKPKGARGRV